MTGAYLDRMLEISSIFSVVTAGFQVSSVILSVIAVHSICCRSNVKPSTHSNWKMPSTACSRFLFCTVMVVSEIVMTKNHELGTSFVVLTSPSVICSGQLAVS